MPTLAEMIAALRPPTPRPGPMQDTPGAQPDPNLVASAFEHGPDFLAGMLTGQAPPGQNARGLGALLAAAVPLMGLPKALATLGMAEKTAEDLQTLGVAKSIKAYHGSPHDFERFDVSKIGTGEGAQAYGHGLYFAENPSVANEYKRVLGNRAFKVGDRELVSPMGGSTRALDTQTRGENIATQALDDAFNAQSSSPAQFASSRLRQQAKLYPEEAEHIKEALNVIADWQKTGEVQRMGGKMYEVAIQADPEHFLDWDKPLSQQNDMVKMVAKDAGFRQITEGPFKGRWQNDYGTVFDNPTGRDLHEELARQARDVGVMAGRTGQTTLPGSQAKAAEDLKGFGIPGIKYLDQGSRSAGEGTHNWVVFDDSLVKILAKAGLAAPVIEGLRRKAQAQGGVLSRADVPSVVSQ